MIQRVPSTLLASTLLSDLTRGHAELAGLQARIASGRQIEKASDDPIAAASALDQRGQIRRSEQHDRSLHDAADWLRLSDDALTASGELLASARSLIVQANNNLGTTERESIAVSIEGLRSDILQLANTTRGGRPVFAGTAAGSMAFDAGGAYVGDGGAVVRDTGDGTSLVVNLPGSTAFGDLFDALAQAASDVRSGNPAAMASSLVRTDAAAQTLANGQAVVGARAQQAERLAAQNGVKLDQLRGQLSELEDIDLAQAIVDLKVQEASFQAALGVTGRAVQPTLLDFLR
jgi:flagellar hook-associated protein 3 FlgL